jgi:Pvc16 N-terminal domain
MYRRWRQSLCVVACHHGHVLPDADRSLATWLRRLLPEGTGIRFEAPDPEWTARLPEPRFIDVFLHDVRHDPRGQESGWCDIRDARGRVVGRRPAAQYYRLSYLTTAWSGGTAAERVAAEHEMLGLLLNACAHQGVLPDDCLAGTLAECGQKAVLECSPGDSAGAPGPLWAGLGIAPRVSLELVLVAAATPPVLSEIAPPAREIVLNAAELLPPSRPGAQGADTPPAERRPFGTTRRWEKQTVNEPAK